MNRRGHRLPAFATPPAVTLAAFAHELVDAAPGPCHPHDGATIGDGWLTAAAATHGGTLDETGGLLADLSCLDGPGFSAADLRPEVRHF